MTTGERSAGPAVTERHRARPGTGAPVARLPSLGPARVPGPAAATLSSRACPG